MRSITAAVIVLACQLNPSAAPVQSPDIDELMRRVGTYVHSFVDIFSNVVAEERYEQRLAGRRRQLTSDFLLVAYPGRADRRVTFTDFRFTRQGLDRTLGADIRRIDWVRLRPPQTNQTRGSVWVSEITGEVVRTQLRIGSTGSDRTTTTFQVDRAPDSTTPR